MDTRDQGPDIASSENQFPETRTLTETPDTVTVIDVREPLREDSPAEQAN